MAKRLLLTLLALLGLAAQVAPAQARVCAGVAATVVLAAQEDGGAVVLAGRPARPAAQARTRLAQPVRAIVKVAPGIAPVLVGIDRARE